jgi:hypothetical protein
VDIITLADIPKRPKTRHAYYEDTFCACAMGIRAAAAAYHLRLFCADRLAHTSAAFQLRSSTIRFTRMPTRFWHLKVPGLRMGQGYVPTPEYSLAVRKRRLVINL